MRLAERKDRRSGAKTLQVTAGRRETLEYAQAEWLRGAPDRCLLPFDYDSAGAEARFYYDVTGMERLPRFLRAKVTSGQYVGMLRTVYDVLDLCTRKGYATSSVRFDPSTVYVDGQGAMAFAFVPLSGTGERDNDSPRALLGYLGSFSHVGLVVAEDERHVRAVDDFVRRTPVLSVSALREFLVAQFGLSLEGGSGSLGAPAGAQTPASAPPQDGAPAGGALLDMVGMLSRRASAPEVAAAQSLAERARDGVAGVSPTAASRVMAVAPVAPAAAAGPGPQVADEPGSTPAAGSEPRTADEPGDEPQEKPEPPRATPGETTYFGRGAASFAAGFSTAREGMGRTSFSLERERDGRRFELDLSAPRTVGRSVTSDVTLDGNSNLSRCHVRISRDGDGFEIRDLASLNGTTVRGRRLEAEGSGHVDVGERFLLADEAVRIVS